MHQNRHSNGSLPSEVRVEVKLIAKHKNRMKKKSFLVLMNTGVNMMYSRLQRFLVTHD